MKLLFKQKFFSWFDSYDIYDEKGATVSKQPLNWTDTYIIDVARQENVLHALMLVLAIDAEKCSRRD